MSPEMSVEAALISEAIKMHANVKAMVIDNKAEYDLALTTVASLEAFKGELPVRFTHAHNSLEASISLLRERIGNFKSLVWARAMTGLPVSMLKDDNGKFKVNPESVIAHMRLLQK